MFTQSARNSICNEELVMQVDGNGAAKVFGNLVSAGINWDAQLTWSQTADRMPIHQGVTKRTMASISSLGMTHLELCLYHTLQLFQNSLSCNWSCMLTWCSSTIDYCNSWSHLSEVSSDVKSSNWSFSAGERNVSSQNTECCSFTSTWKVQNMMA